MPPAAPAYPANVYGQPSYGQPLAGAQTDGKATTSLVLGILSVTCLGILAGIPAIILGHISRSNIRDSRGQLKGDGLALAGLVMGYISVAIIPLVLIIVAISIPNLIHARLAANEANAVSSVTTINTAEYTYEASHPHQGFAPNLATLGCASGAESTAEHACLVDHMLGCSDSDWCIKSGYKFHLSASNPITGANSQYVVTAIPVIGGNTGKRNFCATADQIIRSEDALTNRRSTPYTAEECQTLTPL